MIVEGVEFTDLESLTYAQHKEINLRWSRRQARDHDEIPLPPLLPVPGRRRQYVHHLVRGCDNSRERCRCEYVMVHAIDCRCEDCLCRDSGERAARADDGPLEKPALGEALVPEQVGLRFFENDNGELVVATSPDDAEAAFEEHYGPPRDPESVWTWRRVERSETRLRGRALKRGLVPENYYR